MSDAPLGWNWTRSRQTGRPAVSAEMTALIERLAVEDASWVYQRIQGKLLKVGYRAGWDIT
jgi:putative transposase